MKYIINSEKKIVTQKATMEKPSARKEDYANEFSFMDAWEQWDNHITSLKSFPAEWVTADQDGLEVELDKDFRLQHQAIMVYGEPFYYDVNEETYNEVKPEFRRIVAVAIPAQKEGGGELTKEKCLELILRKYHGHTKEQWENELVKEYPYSEIPYLVELVWNEAIKSLTTEPVEEKDDECKHEFETVISCKHCGKKVADNEDVKKYY